MSSIKTTNPPKAIIVGATSGIGRELARLLSRKGYFVGVTGRRTHLLEALQAEYPEQIRYRRIDVSDTANAIDQLDGFISEMNGVDLVVISAGTGFFDPELSWYKEQETIAVNVLGFAAMVNVTYHHFLRKGAGHLVGISSVAAIRGGASPAYNASKAFISNYLEGLRYRITKSGLPILVTNIQPGFVATEMARGKVRFWVASPQKAARQIYRAIKKQKKQAYITKRWKLVGWALKIMPDFIYQRL